MGVLVKMRTVVTGATGSIGFYVVQQLVEQGIEAQAIARPEEESPCCIPGGHGKRVRIGSCVTVTSNSGGCASMLTREVVFGYSVFRYQGVGKLLGRSADGSIVDEATPGLPRHWLFKSSI